MHGIPDTEARAKELRWGATTFINFLFVAVRISVYFIVQRPGHSCPPLTALAIISVLAFGAVGFMQRARLLQENPDTMFPRPTWHMPGVNNGRELRRGLLWGLLACGISELLFRLATAMCE